MREKAKKLFLSMAIAAKHRRDKINDKLKTVEQLQDELRIAELILDSLSEKKTLKVRLLIRINTRIQNLKNKIENIKERFKDPWP